MRKLTLLLIFCPLLAFGQISNWQGLTAEQLSAITSGSTNIASKSYWTSNAYAQIRDLYDMLTVSTFTVNSATPTIEDAAHYVTANTSTTAITSLTFTGDYYKVIYIHINDAYTTFTDGASLDCGGVNLAPSSGDIMVAYYDDNGNDWKVKFFFLADL